MKLQIIATAHNGFSDKFGIPRQSRPDSQIETRIVFEPTFRDENMLRGIEEYSHLWLVWGFHLVADREAERLIGGEAERQWKATVRPPRLGGNVRMGVFATRSPFRPNPIGLSSVELLRVEKTAEGPVLVVRGADVLDGTPIYDIKPYLSYSDSHPDARNGFGEATKDYRLKVEWGDRTAVGSLQDGAKLLQDGASAYWLEAEGRRGGEAERLRGEIEEILSQDPRPAYQEDPERVYKIDYAGWRVSFRVEGETVYILKVESGEFRV